MRKRTTYENIAVTIGGTLYLAILLLAAFR